MAYNHFTSGTVVVKTGTGFLHTLSVSSSSSGGTVTLYDGVGATGNVIARVNFVNNVTVSLELDVTFSAGLTAVVSGALGDYTVSYT